LTVVAKLPDGKEVRFGIGIATRILSAEDRSEDNRKINICLLIAELSRLAAFRNGTRDENTAFVRYILSGLSVIHQHWPITIGGRFYTDRESYSDLRKQVEFDVPDENEISNL
jgi:hypothetical protein